MYATNVTLKNNNNKKEEKNNCSTLVYDIRVMKLLTMTKQKKATIKHTFIFFTFKHIKFLTIN